MNFFKTYKSVDNICKDMYSSDDGVTAYINEMQACTNTSFQTENWKEDFTRLNDVRDKINQIAHEVDCNEENILEKQDAKWLEEFHNKLLNKTDPLALYTKAIDELNSLNTQTVDLLKEEVEDLYKEDEKDLKSNNSKKTIGKVLDLLYALLAVGLIGYILFIK